MRSPSSKTTSAALLAALAPLAAHAHSWVEQAFRLDASGAMVGDPGYARGWVARDSTNPPWKDSIPQCLLPPSGQSAYSGQETLNKYKFDANPKFPMLQAAPGDHISLLHLENGHTTLPQNQPKKPHNRGTIFIYGTADPKEDEKLFDVHLKWDRAGTGGDKRGRLLATRNYDDGQCYQPNPGELSVARAKALAGEGASHDRELACQSDLQLPDDLKPGSTYTLYWYWDWPDLDATKINMDETKNGVFPWAGTFMRGEKDPHGFAMDVIARNESYSSVVDIKVVDKAKLPGDSAKAAASGSGNVYSQAIKAQMTGNFQVDIDANQAAPRSEPASQSTSEAPPAATTAGPSSAAPTTTTADSSSAAPTTGPSSGPAPPSTSGDANGGGAVTVTKTVTVPPTTIIATVFITNTPGSSMTPSSSSMPASDTASAPVGGANTPPGSTFEHDAPGTTSRISCTSKSTPNVYATASAPSTSSSESTVVVTSHSTSTATVTATPAVYGRAARRNWRFGQ